MNEETLKKLVGNENPFKVPEGYFEGFKADIMQSIDDAEKKKRSRIIKMSAYWLSAAAALIGAAFIGFSYLHQNESNEQIASEIGKSIDGENIDEALDYAMVSNAEIYFYLTEE